MTVKPQVVSLSRSLRCVIRERAKLEEAIKARQEATQLVVELAQSEWDIGNVIAFPACPVGCEDRRRGLRPKRWLRLSEL
jgi:hypothetical protein